MSGLILIDRSMLKHHIVGIDNPLRFSAWCWMLSKARYKAGTYFDAGHEISLERGQFVCGRKHMSDETGMSQKQVRTFLAVLERSSMVTKAVHPKGQGITILTICKYEEYQDFSKYRDTKGPSKGPAKGQGGAKVGPHSVTPEETPEETPVILGAQAPSRKRGTRLSDEWFLPKDYGTWAIERGLTEAQIRFEAERFHDHWLGASGQRGVKLDWKAVWRNWIRKFIADGGLMNGKRTYSETASHRDSARIVDENAIATGLAISRATGRA